MARAVRAGGRSTPRRARTLDAQINLHVFTSGCPEVDRLLMFGDWLRTDSRRARSLRTHGAGPAWKAWDDIQRGAGAKTPVIDEIVGRAGRAAAQ